MLSIGSAEITELGVPKGTAKEIKRVFGPACVKTVSREGERNLGFSLRVHHDKCGDLFFLVPDRDLLRIKSMVGFDEANAGTVSCRFHKEALTHGLFLRKGEMRLFICLSTRANTIGEEDTFFV